MQFFTHIPFDWPRRNRAFDIRLTTSVQSRDAIYTGDDGHVTNGDETRFPLSLLGSFTKGLPHALDTSLLLNRSSFDAFVRAIDTGDVDFIKTLPLGPDPTGANNFFSSAMASGANTRGWESMAAGLAFTLEGPDAQRVTMPPAPQIDSVELGYEMSEAYWMALCRDVAFNDFGSADIVKAAAESLGNHPWLTVDQSLQQQEQQQQVCYNNNNNNNNSNLLTPAETRRREFELRNGMGITTDTVFRGVLQGDDIGPYLSQFLIIGCDTLGGFPRTDPAAYITGLIRYGSNRIDQRVRKATPSRDYMTTWGAYIDVTNGADVRGRESYVAPTGPNFNDEETHTFIHTPRDLATYVHYDALYQAYFNACLLLLAIGADFDDGIPFTKSDVVDKQTGFVLWGEPHILSLLVEVVQKSLKAVRFQKFNVHRRTRPETVAGWVDCVKRPRPTPVSVAAATSEGAGQNGFEKVLKPIEALCRYVDDDLLNRVREHNFIQNDTQLDGDNNLPRRNDFDPVLSSTTDHCKSNQKQQQYSQQTAEQQEQEQKAIGTFLLPMAFAEGSPMHASYGAGHATVAGACTTILKAFFNTNDTLPFTFKTSANGTRLEQVKCEQKLRVGDELNKLCSNVSIGRDWAGVHWRSDYTESIKLGEEVALGLLREQANIYVEQFSMTVPLFDGGVEVISNRK
uniref:Vanadium-dependent bromoperoxidase 3 n=1 Tax=Laurencia nipponica TaxID=860636 RepID=A0A2Z6DQZ2_9FLOR|nr:vanadium-dependent bromoperoxidase 3 [Laurencia nipponica]